MENYVYHVSVLCYDTSERVCFLENPNFFPFGSCTAASSLAVPFCIRRKLQQFRNPDSGLFRNGLGCSAANQSTQTSKRIDTVLHLSRPSRCCRGSCSGNLILFQPHQTQRQPVFHGAYRSRAVLFLCRRKHCRRTNISFQCPDRLDEQ